MTPIRRFDINAHRTRIALVIGWLALAYHLDSPWLVSAAAVVLIVGALRPRLDLIRWLHLRVFRRYRLIAPDFVAGRYEPHRFAYGVGGVLLALAGAALWVGWTTLGWAVTGGLIVLAVLYFLAGWCPGCQLYVWLRARDLAPFVEAPLNGVR
jgi:hypothetical protein